MGAVAGTAQAQAAALLAMLTNSVPEKAEYADKFAKLENRLAYNTL